MGDMWGRWPLVRLPPPQTRQRLAVQGWVYVIWSEDAGGSRKVAVYVGQGKPVADCLARHRDEVTITRHGRNGRVMRATWAKVRKEERGGVERFLADTLRPLEGDRWSSDSPVPVNLPW